MLQTAHKLAALPIKATAPASLRDLLSQLRTAKLQLATNKSNAPKLRESYLTGLAKAILT
jgi:hypothetical protein